MIAVITKNSDYAKEIITVSVPKTYIVKYDKECAYWSGDDRRDRMFINDIAAYLSSKLNIGVYVMMNDVFEALGMARRGDGYLVGWRPGSRIRIQVKERDENGGYLLKIITDGIIIDEF